MNWPTSILLGALTAIAGAASSGFMAFYAIGWQSVGDREGGRVSAILWLVLLGALAGLAIGMVAARLEERPGRAGFRGGLRVAVSMTLGLVGSLGALAFVVSDHLPRVGGFPLDLEIEVRCPVEFELPNPTNAPAPVLQLSGANGAHRDSGVLNLAGAEQVEGRWVVPGRIALRAREVRRILLIQIPPLPGETNALPLPVRLRAPDPRWSEWLPRADAASERPQSRYSYRFRLQRPSARPDRTPAGAGQVGDPPPADGPAMTLNSPPR